MADLVGKKLQKKGTDLLMMKLLQHFGEEILR